MVSRGAGFASADAGAARPGAAWRAISSEKLPSAADRLVKRDCEILLMSFSFSTILPSGTDGTLPYVTPASTLRAAIRSKVTSPAAFVKRGVAGPGRLNVRPRPHRASSREKAGRYSPRS